MSKNDKEIIDQAILFVQKELRLAEAGHDWWHIERVYNNCLELAEDAKIDGLVLRLGALLHDIGDSKFHQGYEDIGRQKIASFLAVTDLSEERKNHLMQIIANISFRKSFDPSGFRSKELDILQDADRLDAIGAIGIARAFSFGGYKGNVFYDPAILPDLNMDKNTYKKSNKPTINHFYEKLLKLKSMMNTEKGKQMAEERHRYMVSFLHQFYREAGIDPAIYENFATQI